MRWGALQMALGLASVSLVAPATAGAAMPPDPRDPCVTGSRDSCGTTGVGFYRSGRYGVRWFGDFRGAVPGEPHTFCLDLRFWYASASYRYRERSAHGLESKDGVAITAEKQRRMAYALWEFGRSSSPARQVAVMLYVHSLMGDARAGELDRAGLGSAVASTYRTIAADSRRFHGPYRIQTRLSGALTVGKRATATIRLLSASGRALAGTRLTLGARGARGLARRVDTDADGVARISFTPTAGRLSLRVASADLAANAPRIFVPTSGTAAANGQRLAAPASERVSITVPLAARPALSTSVSARIVRPGSPVFERIRVRGLGATSTQVSLQLFGPFPKRADVDCRSRRLWKGRVRVGSGGEARSPAVRLTRAGFYAYRAALAGGSSATACAAASDTLLAAPGIVAGRGDTYAATPAGSASALRPTRVRVPALGIDARVKPAAIDVRHGVLAIPLDIAVAGWWQDGGTPGSGSGATLVAGHVDSARAGAGAFYRLGAARVGAVVRLATAGRRTYAYRVVSVRSYPKSALPTAIYSREGPARLVLVTCGGPFDEATGHYRDNVVVTAVPAGRGA
jgi:hypothetical protein